MNRLDLVVDDLTMKLSQRDRADAQREYQAMASNAGLMIEVLGGPDLAAYAIRTKIARLWINGKLTTGERNAMMRVAADWDGSSVVEQSAVLALLVHVGGRHGPNDQGIGVARKQ